MATAPATTASTSDDNRIDDGKCQADSWLIIIGILIQICYYNYDYLKFKTVWNGL